MPTAVDNMSPNNPFVATLSAIPVDPGVTAYSIIAVKGDGPVESGDDGVVQYKSAHINGVSRSWWSDGSTPSRDSRRRSWKCGGSSS